MPFVDESGQPVTLTPEEQAQYFQQSGQQAAPGTLVDDQGKPVDPFSLPAEDLAGLVKQSPDKFDLISQFSARPDLQKDPAMVQKVADAFHQVRQQPIDWKDLASHAPENIGNVIAGLARYGVKVTSGTLKQLASLGFAADPTKTPEEQAEAAAIAQEESRQELGEAAASTEQGMTGLLSGAVKTAQALGRGLHISKGLADYTDEDKRNALFDALGRAQQAQGIASGQNALAQAVTGGAVPVRPEEVAKLSDPFSWQALGVGFRGAGNLAQDIKGAAAAVAPETAAKIAELTKKIPSPSDIAPKLAGKTLTGAAQAGAAVSRGLEKAAGPIGAVGTPVYAAITHDPHLFIGSLLFGSKAGKVAASGLKSTAKGLDAVADFGKQISGAAPLTSAYAQTARAALEAAPAAAAELAKGVGFDLSQVAGADTPQEKEAAIGLGTAFGLLGAANAAGRHVISGQLIAPRDYPTSTPVRGSGAFPSLDALHNSEFNNLNDGQKARINATRLFLSKAAPGTDVFVTGNNPEVASQALQEAGMSPEQADFYAKQKGFSTRLNGRKIIGVQEPGSAPHESFHGIEDVLGESKMRELDALVKQQYAGNWEDFGRYYTDRLTGSDPGADWRAPLLDASGWGNAEATEKLYRETANKFVEEAQRNGQPPPTEEQIKDAVRAGGPVDWRTVLTPEEQTAASDRYIAREKLAENFDAVFKHTGGTLEEGKQLPDKIARVVGQVMQFFGVNPIAGARSAELGVPLSPEVISKVREAGKSVLPDVSAAPILRGGERVAPMIAPVSGTAPAPVANTARQLASQQPDVPLPGQNQSQREIAGAAAEAFANDAGLHLQYSTAPEEPAASLSLGMNRNDRRSMIEAFRQMPDSARKLFGKLFFPKKFVQTKASGLQIQGWSPEVFAANAHRWGKFLAENMLDTDSPWEMDKNGLTEKGWQDLYADLQNFVANQRAGQTGAGEALVVPKRVTEAGYFAPPTVGEAGAPISQEKADVINMLFGFKLPGKEGAPTRAGGGATRLPQNIAGRLISEATQPGRTSVPVEPRGAFGGAAAERQGIAGEPVTEVNPYRARLESQAKALGVSAPSMIESWQNLNLNRIKEAEVAPEQAKFGANPLTLQAGFLPADRGVANVADEYLKSKGITPRPSTSAPVNENLAKRLADFYQEATHAPEAPEVKSSYDALTKETVAQYNAITNAGYAIEPFTGEGEPYKSSAEMIADVRDNKHLYYLPTTGSFGGPTDNLMLRPSGIGDAPINDIFRAVHDFFGHAKEGYQFGPKGEFNAWREHSKMFSPEAQGALAAETLAQNSWVNFGKHLQTESGKIPQKGEPGYIPASERPFAEQKNIAVPSGMIQEAGAEPKTFVVRHGSTEMNNADPDKDLIRGHIDVPLDDKGRREAQDTGKQIAEQGGVNHIITSDLGRTVDTAKAIAEHNPGATITEDPGLRPWNFGPSIEGKPTSQMLPKIRELTENPDQRPPGGETFNEFKDRFLEAFHRAQDTTQDQNSAIVTHYRGTKLLDAWRKTGVDNDTIDKAAFEEYDKSKKPGNVEVIDKTGAALAEPKTAPTTAPEESQFSPAARRRSKQDWELKTGPGMFSKAWITPEGKPVQLGDQMHHDWLNENPAIKKQYGIKGSDEDNRVEALQKGFARVNYEKNTGTLKVEARAKDWPKLQESVKELAKNNLGRIDNMDVHLLDVKARKIVAQDGVQLHTYPTVEEKMEQLPFIGTAGGVTEVSPQASSAGAQFSPRSLPPHIDPTEDRKFSTAESSLYLAPTGKLYPAEHSHWDFAKKYLAPGSEDPKTVTASKGWRQINMFGGHIEVDHGKITASQRETIKDLQATHNLPVLGPDGRGIEGFESEAPSDMIGGQYLPSPHPRALRSAAIRDPETGQIFEGPFHAAAVAEALGLPSYRNATEATMQSFEHGFTTNEGDFLNREEAHKRAMEMKQIEEGRDVTKSASFQKKGGIGIEHLKNEVLTQMNENRKAIPNLVSQALPADSAGVTNRKDIADARREWAEKGTESPYFKRWFGDSKVVDSEGNPQVVYHGTTHKFSAFGDKRNNPENSLGAGHYFTTDKFDAANNYAGVGPDLANRIIMRAEMLESEGADRGAAMRTARRELVGKEERLIPAYLKAENPVILDKEGNTSTRFDYQYDEDTGQETGSAIDLHDSLLSVARQHGVDGQKIWNDITANGIEDLNAYDVWKGIKDSEEAMYGNDPQGRLMGSEIARQVFQDMGFDGIELTHPATEFPGMDIGRYAKHYVVFNPEQIKGAQNRGTFSQQDPRYQFLPAAKVENFKDEAKLPEALHNSQYAIITANKEAVGLASHPTNQLANDNLEKALIADGYQPHEVSGEYKGIDQGKSFIVPGMTPQEAIHYANNYGQESVLTPHGLLYPDGTINPAVPEKTIVGDEAKKEDGWSQVKGGPAFSMGLDFDRREPLQALPQDLFGAPLPEEKKAGLSTLEKSKLTKAGIAQQYSEVVIPKKRDAAIPSDIIGSPLYKEAAKQGGEKAAVSAFADRLESLAKQYQDHPSFKDGAAWYDHIAPAINKAFGKTGQIFAELLAATSPGQTPDLNFRDALQAHDRLIAGDYDKKIEKYNQGLEMADDEKKWKSWLAKHGTDLPANPTPETFLGQWIDFHDLKLTKHNGKLFGHNSVPVLNVAARKWLADAGLKTSNFVKNLLGIGHEATIDLWADRTMRWAGYEGKQARWRILPENKSGVDDKDFHFAQKVFAETAKRLGMRPDQLQGALWFAEKQRWADNGWSPLNLGTYEPEFAKIPATRAKVAQEQQLRALGEKIKPLTGTQSELMVEPRNVL